MNNEQNAWDIVQILLADLNNSLQTSNIDVNRWTNKIVDSLAEVELITPDNLDDILADARTDGYLEGQDVEREYQRELSYGEDW